jgi:hypothetical protein
MLLEDQKPRSESEEEKERWEGVDVLPLRGRLFWWWNSY